MPISIRSVGHYSVSHPFQDNPNAVKRFVEFYWGIEGHGQFVIKGKPYLFKPGFATYYLPMEPHLITSKSPKWVYRWFTFDGPLAVDLITDFNYPREPFFAGSCPEDLFIKLEEGIREITPGSQKMLGPVGYSILASAGIRKKDSLNSNHTIREFIDFVKNNYGNETININTIADMLKIHRTTLNKAIRKEMRMSPSEYLIKFRVQKALSMLRESTLPISEIGSAVGFPDNSYFSKVIRKAVNMSPAMFRKQF